MPKDEFDFEDPFELNGMAFLSREDTTTDMAECFAEEFMRMGYNHKQILELFRNPQYLGPHMAYEKRGEPFIRDLIADVFARWGKTVTWPALETENTNAPEAKSHVAPEPRPYPIFSPKELLTMNFRPGPDTQAPTARIPLQSEGDETLIDPLGAPIPKLNI